MEEKTFWESIIRGVGAKPYDIPVIKGSSGIEHHALSVGVDQEKRRLIIIIRETNARASSLIHADIQSEYPSIKVITAYPVPANRNVFESTSLSSFLNNSILGLWLSGAETEVKSVLEKIKDRMHSVFPEDLQKDWYIMDIIRALRPMSVREPSEKFDDKYLVLNKLAVKIESDKGICPIPIYDFSDDEFALLKSGGSELDIRDILQNNGIYQYFFPPPDNLALGLVEQTKTKNKDEIVRKLLVAPEMGHPFAENEILEKKFNLTNLIDALQERNLIVEGGLRWEITPDGESIRNTVKYKPRESLLSKIINRISINIDLKSIFKI